MAVDYDKVGFQLGAAGLGIGAFSGILDVMSACSKLYKLWRSLRELDGHLGLLRAKLVLQHALLQQWERDWLSAPVESKERSGFRRRQRWIRQHEVAVTETLHAVRRLLESLEPLRLTSSAQHGKTGAAAALESLNWVHDKAAESERALDQLDSLLAGLYRLLPPMTPNSEASQVILAVEDLQDSQIDARDVSSNRTTQSTLGLRQLGKQLNLELENRVQQFSHRPVTSNLAIKTSRVQVGAHDEVSAGFRSFGFLDGGEPILIEWKRYDASWMGQKGIELHGRISNIAQLLHTDTKPDELLTLKCLGFFDDVERSAFGFVFQLPLASAAAPAPAPNGKPMISLKTLLDQPTPENLPTLEERLQASYGIALSISILHAVSWLHKSIRSQNVLFPVDRNGCPRWTTPYLVGFDFSRPDAVDESSEKPEQSARFNVYRHPSAQGSPNEGYRRSFDVYSLGVVLLEIGLWRPAWKLYKDGMAAEAFRDVLVDKSKAWLGHLMGTVYREAAVKCLTGSFDAQQAKTGDGHDDDLGLQTLYIEVVEVLGRLQED
ncbi:hypothetical protein BN1708_013945 [Verticillium longisporum]|uniref:Protein kinase domain-containing protein n=2 Tax=Verticillium longisporum TaxID=100787 RepID=A0A0G4LQR3_VERLO|nr:hypothetical protein HYQ44_000662 [Verticillium longisporum]CRK24386.1 hypothetical protein BN1708_013945 [Verticillium longisporum]